MPSDTAPRRFASRFASLAGLLLAAACTAPVAAAPDTPVARTERIEAGKLALERVTLPLDGAGAPVRYVLAPAGRKAPLVLFIQGSGCIPPFLALDTPQRRSTLFGWLPLAAGHRYAVMAVDKPYQPDAMPSGQPGTATDCPAAFNAHFSYDSWLATLTAALRDALARPDVDAGRVLVVGVSEGAAMAAGLARAVPAVTHVALVGGPPGATQLYDFALNAYFGPGGDEDNLRRLRELDAIVDAIHADPRSADKFYAGHTYLRWSSFFAQSHGEDLARSTARVYMVDGMRDASVPILSTEVAYARLRGLGRDVTFRRIPNAGHSLVAPGAAMADTQQAYDAIMAWFEGKPF